MPIDCGLCGGPCKGHAMRAMTDQPADPLRERLHLLAETVTKYRVNPEWIIEQVRDLIDEAVAPLREALKSIAANTCCDRCHEAALVAQAALAERDKPAEEKK